MQTHAKGRPIAAPTGWVTLLAKEGWRMSIGVLAIVSGALRIAFSLRAHAHRLDYG